MKIAKYMIIFVLLCTSKVFSGELDLDLECILAAEVSKEFANLRDQGVEFSTVLAEIPAIAHSIGEAYGYNSDGIVEIRRRSLQSVLGLVYSDSTITPEVAYYSSINGCID